jgi:hypothetical protein
MGDLFSDAAGQRAGAIAPLAQRLRPRSLDDFELEFEDGTLWLEADTAEEIWSLFSESAPPVIALVQRLDAEQAKAFHQAFVELYESYRDDSGAIRAPRRYLLVLGRRK